MPIQYIRHPQPFPFPKVVYLFGHRQQMGKDSCCDILQNILNEKNISYRRTLFAKMLKKHAADRYGLDLAKMEDQAYKLSVVPHAAPKEDGSPRTVRDILIEEGRFARSIWGDTWAWQVYNELYSCGADVGIVSDYRYPNEGDPDSKMYNLFVENAKATHQGWSFEKPKVVKIQVYRPDGIFKNDGADAELTDAFAFYDYNIINDPRPDWKENLKKQLTNILAETYKG